MSVFRDNRFFGDEFNRIRVEISKRYCSIDAYFQSRVHCLWSQVAAIFQKHLGELVTGGDSEEALKLLCKCLDDASEPCPELSEAVKSLLALRLEYRTHLHPRVRRELDGLNQQIRNPENGELINQIMVDFNETGAEDAFLRITQLAKQAAYLTKNALISEAVTPTLVLYAAAEQFEDALIRSGNSDLEFNRLARSYKGEIWPGIFEGLDEDNARFKKVKKTIQSIRDISMNIEKGNLK
jgi:hypothetical protein